MKNKISAISVLQILCITTFVLLLLIGLRLPTYSDEIDYFIIQTRHFLDHGMLTYLFPDCRGGFIMQTPLSWLLPRAVHGAAFSKLNPQVDLRYWGVGFLAIITMLNAKYFNKLGYGKLDSVAMATAIFSIGTMPLLATMVRPEIFIQLAITVTLLLTLGNGSNSKLLTAARTALIIFIFFYISALHAKAIFLYPFFLLASLYGLKRWLPKIIVITLVTFCTLQTITAWQTRTSCPERSFLNKILNSQAITPANLVSRPFNSANKMLVNTFKVNAFYEQLKFQKSYQSDWVGGEILTSTPLDMLLNLTIKIIAYLSMAIVLFLIFYTSKNILKKKEIYHNLQVLSLALAGYALIVLYFNRNFYNVSVIHYLITMAAIMAFTQFPKFQKFKKALMLVVYLFVVISNSRLIFAYTTDLNSSWSLINNSTKKQQADLNELILLCKPNLEQAIIMDKLAYSSLRQSPTPVLSDYTFGWWGTDMNIAAVKKRLSINTFLSSCSYLNEQERKNSVERNGFCCLKYFP